MDFINFIHDPLALSDFQFTALLTVLFILTTTPLALLCYCCMIMKIESARDEVNDICHIRTKN